jgi:hypothetical protein
MSLQAGKFAPVLRERRKTALRIAVVSTPRCGNTWLRMLLSRVCDATQYAIHTPDDFDWKNIGESSSIVLQLHWLPDRDFIRKLRENQFKVITLARHPLDVLLSILQFSPREPQTARWLEGMGGNEQCIHGHEPSSEAFLRYATGPRAKALLSVSYEWSKRSDVLVVRYENLVVATVDVIGLIMGDLDPSVIVGDDILGAAVEQTSLPFLRKTSVNGHFWQGIPGLWSSLLNKEKAQVIRAAHSELFEHFGYDIDDAVNFPDEVSRLRWREMCR